MPLPRKCNTVKHYLLVLLVITIASMGCSSANLKKNKDAFNPAPKVKSGTMLTYSVQNQVSMTLNGDSTKTESASHKMHLEFLNCSDESLEVMVSYSDLEDPVKQMACSELMGQFTLDFESQEINLVNSDDATAQVVAQMDAFMIESKRELDKNALANYEKFKSSIAGNVLQLFDGLDEVLLPYARSYSHLKVDTLTEKDLSGQQRIYVTTKSVQKEMACYLVSEHQEMISSGEAEQATEQRDIQFDKKRGYIRSYKEVDTVLRFGMLAQSRTRFVLIE